MKKLSILLLSILSAISIVGAQQRVSAGLEINTFFDNKEFASNGDYAIKGEDYDGLGTDFALRLTPSFTFDIDDNNSIVIGSELYNHFGEQSDKYFSDAKPIAFYRYEDVNSRYAAGIFPRSEHHIDSYSAAFYSRSHLFFSNRVQGVMWQQNWGNDSFFEFVCDWEGMYSVESREIFRLLTAMRQNVGGFYYGYNFSMLHFASKQNGNGEGVVDLVTFNPAIGFRHQGVLNFDVKLGAIAAPQRDRLQRWVYEDSPSEWLTPVMGELAIKLNYKGFHLENELYVGDNINPLFGGYTTPAGMHLEYGRALYPNQNFFRTEEGYYNRTAIAYRKKLAKDMVSVNFEIAAHTCGEAVGTEYFVEVNAKLFKSIYKQK